MRNDEDSYDPCKREYVVPASASEVAEGLASLQRKQADLLQSAIARRQARSQTAQLEVLEHYRQVAEDLRQSSCSPVPLQDQGRVHYAVCSEPASLDRMHVTLACGQSLRCFCTVKCATGSFGSRPICRHPNCLNNKQMAERKEKSWLRYQNIRARRSHAAVGETSVEPRSGLLTTLTTATPRLATSESVDLTMVAKHDRTDAHLVGSLVADDLIQARISASQSRKAEGDASNASIAASNMSQRGCWIRAFRKTKGDAVNASIASSNVAGRWCWIRALLRPMRLRHAPDEIAT